MTQPIGALLAIGLIATLFNRRVRAGGGRVAMLGRRRLMAGLGWGWVASRWPGAAALAGAASSEGRENCSFMQETRASLQGAVERGESAPNARRTAVCPLCGERVSVSAA